MLAGAPPGLVGLLIEDVPEIVEAPRMRRPPFRQPAFARLPALPGPGGEAQYLDLDAAPLERARENVGRNRRDRDRPPPHRSRIVDQQGDDQIGRASWRERVCQYV